MGNDDLDAVLARLEGSPRDHELRRIAAEALDDRGRREEAMETLAPLVNLTSHDEDGLPCLCKDCIVRAGAETEAQGMRFVRSFAVVGTRVLHFWMLAELERERAAVRASVASALRQKLAKRKQR
jgi:hypothetical protein